MFNRSRIKCNSVNCLIFNLIILLQISFFLLIMSSKCPICDRTFSRRTAYSQHVQVCLKKADEEFNNGGVVNTQSIDNEEHNIVEIYTRNNEKCEMDDNEMDDNEMDDNEMDDNEMDDNENDNI